MNGRPRIVIADDQEAIRYFLCRLAQAEGEIVCEAQDGERAIDAVERFDPDLLIVDASMPGISGFEVARLLAERRPGLPIIMTSQHTDPVYAEEAFRLGVKGYVVKGRAATDLAAAIRAVLAGGSFRTEVSARRAT